MKVRKTLSAAFLCSLLNVAAHAATEPPADFLKAMPEPDVILAEFPGAGDLDLSARRVAALDILSDIVEGYSRKDPGGNWLVPEERALNGRYKSAADGIRAPIYRAFAPDDTKMPYEKSRRGKWNKQVDGYREDERFVSSVLQHVPPEVRDRYLTSLRKNLAFRHANESVGSAKRGNKPGVPRWLPYTGLALVVLAVGRAIPTPALKNGRVVLEHATTGQVVGANKYSETHMYSTGGGRTSDGDLTPVTVHSYAVTKQEFFLTRPDGSETPVQFSGYNVPLRDGQRVTMVSASVAGKRGLWMRLVNHDARAFWNTGNANAAVREWGLCVGILPRILIGLGLFAAILFLGFRALVFIMRSSWSPIHDDNATLAALIGLCFVALSGAFSYWWFQARQRQAVAAQIDTLLDEHSTSVLAAGP